MMDIATLITRRNALALELAAVEAEIASATVQPADLLKTLSVCKGGETLYLDDADFGDLSLKAPKWEAPVTLIGGRFKSMKLMGVPGLRLESTAAQSIHILHVNKTPSSNIDLNRVRAGSITLQHVQGFAVNDCLLSSTEFPLLITGSVDGVVRGTEITDWLEDALRIVGGSRRIVVEGCHFHNPSPYILPKTHSDLIQMFGRNGAGPEDITIRRNVLRGTLRANRGSGVLTQGFLVNNHTGGGFRNIIIEENLIDAASVTVAVFDGMVEGCAFRRNSVLHLDGGKIGQVRVVNSPGMVVENNIVPLITDLSAGTELAAKMGENLMWRRGVSPFPVPVGTLADFVPRSETEVLPGMGATVGDIRANTITG